MNENVVCDLCKGVNEEMYVCSECGNIMCNICIIKDGEELKCPKCENKE